MFSECHKNDTFGGLCVKTPREVWPVVKVVGIATLKALLTVATFGIRVPAGIFIRESSRSRRTCRGQAPADTSESNVKKLSHACGRRRARKSVWTRHRVLAC